MGAFIPLKTLEMAIYGKGIRSDFVYVVLAIVIQ